MRQDAYAQVFGDYKKEKCNKMGGQMPNLTKSQQEGLDSLKKRIKNMEVVICTTDKSGKFAIVGIEEYKRMGLKHTLKDKVITEEQAAKFQRQLIGHCKVWTKILNTGGDWGHRDRVMDTVVDKGVEVPPMYLLIKDHKGRDQDGLLPTRPVVSACSSMGVHLLMYCQIS